jgi:hypothetical protein
MAALPSHPLSIANLAIASVPSRKWEEAPEYQNFLEERLIGVERTFTSDTCAQFLELVFEDRTDFGKRLGVARLEAHYQRGLSV